MFMSRIPPHLRDTSILLVPPLMAQVSESSDLPGGLMLSHRRETMMPNSTDPTASNQLLTNLDKEAWSLVEPYLEHVELKRGDVLGDADCAPTHAYFPLSGMGSVIGRVEGRVIEVGIFGREGMSPMSLILGSETTPHASMMQIGGAAWRIPADALFNAIAGSASLKAKLLRYAHAFHVQVAETAMAAGLLSVEQRLARWLVMCADRTDDGEVRLTHDMLAAMLAVHRPGVTLALQALEGRGLIRARRGQVKLLERRKLLEFAGRDFGRADAEFTGLPGQPGAADRPDNNLIRSD